MKHLILLVACAVLTACPNPHEPESNVCPCGGAYGPYDKTSEGRMGMLKQSRYCDKCGKAQTREYYQNR